MGYAHREVPPSSSLSILSPWCNSRPRRVSMPCCTPLSLGGRCCRGRSTAVLRRIRHSVVRLFKLRAAKLVFRANTTTQHQRRCCPRPRARHPAFHSSWPFHAPFPHIPNQLDPHIPNHLAPSLNPTYFMPSNSGLLPPPSISGTASTSRKWPAGGLGEIGR